MIVVRFKSFKVGRVLNATHCENGYIKVGGGSPITLLVTCQGGVGLVWSLSRCPRLDTAKFSPVMHT